MTYILSQLQSRIDKRSNLIAFVEANKEQPFVYSQYNLKTLRKDQILDKRLFRDIQKMKKDVAQLTIANTYFSNESTFLCEKITELEFDLAKYVDYTVIGD